MDGSEDFVISDIDSESEGNDNVVDGSICRDGEWRMLVNRGLMTQFKSDCIFLANIIVEIVSGNNILLYAEKGPLHPTNMFCVLQASLF
jgi:hypothetical protein